MIQEPAIPWPPGARGLVYLARHGQTESNVQGRYAGFSDEATTAAGRAQMNGLAALGKWKADLEKKAA